MLERLPNNQEYEKYSDEWLLDLYFRYGSVEEVIRSHPEHLAVSVATFHRKVASRGLVKSAGHRVSFPEVLHFFREKTMKPNTPLERVYREMPPSFRTSMVSLHRIYNAVEKEIVRRNGTALIISHPEDPTSILVGNESMSNSRYGKTKGDVSFPMGFSKRDEDGADSILRILQNEFSNKLAISGELVLGSGLVNKFIDDNNSPFMYLDIVDVRVKAFHLVCPKKLVDLELADSYRLNGLRFENIYDLQELGNLRLGISEIVKEYENALYGNEHIEEPKVVISELNQALLFAHN